MPGKHACDRFTPHLFLSNNRCRDCDFSEDEHITLDSLTASPRGRAATLEEKVDVLVKAQCSHYTPHAWIVDRCRDCGRSEFVHATSAHSVSDEPREAPKVPGKLPRVNAAPIRNEAEIAVSLTQNSNRCSSAVAANNAAVSASSLQIKGGIPAKSMVEAHRVMEHAVTQMVMMGEELEDVQAREAERLRAQDLSQIEYDAKMAEIQSAFAAKERQLKEEVEAAKRAIEEEKAAMASDEAKKRADVSNEIEQMRAEADAAKQEAERLKAEVMAARQEAEAARAAAASERERREAEAQAHATAPATPVAELVADEPKPVEESKQAEEPVAAIILPQRASVSEQIDEPVLIEKRDTVVNNSDEQPADDEAVRVPHEEDEEEAQPTQAVDTIMSGPYSGTVNLNDVLLKVEKLFLTGKNYFRFQYKNKKPVISTLFLRVIADEYVLCWSSVGSRTVHQTRTLPFSQIRAIVIGKQATLLQRPEFADAPENQCFSIIGDYRCLHLMAGNERDAEMTAFGLASLMKESRLPVAVYDLGQYVEHETTVSIESGNEAEEENDNSPLIKSITDFDALNATNTATETSHRYSVTLSVRCQSLPLTHSNTIICLVDREEKTDRLIYVGQTELISKTDSPTFSKSFTIDYELGSVRQLRFNVYDISSKSTEINDSDRIGSIKLDIKELVENDGIDFIYLLNHREHAKNYKLLDKRSTIAVQCVSRMLIQSNGSSASQDPTQLTHFQSILIKGDVFTYYTDSNNPSVPLQVQYQIPPSSAATTSFVLGSLVYHPHNDSKLAQSMLLRSICDVYVGKKHKNFPSSARGESCFSLLSKTGERLDLEAKNRQQRDDWVNGITGLLKHAADQARKRAAQKLGV